MYKTVLHKPHDSPEYMAYKKYRNMYNMLRRKAKLQYNHELISSCRNDSKKMWEVLNRITGKRKLKSCLSDEIIIDGVKSSNPKIISNAFAKYYSQIGKVMSEKIEQQGPTLDPTTNVTNRVNESCFFFPTTHYEIERLIKGLKSKNSKGHDEMSNRILKAVYPIAYFMRFS